MDGLLVDKRLTGMKNNNSLKFRAVLLMSSLVVAMTGCGSGDKSLGGMSAGGDASGSKTNDTVGSASGGQNGSEANGTGGMKPGGGSANTTGGAGTSAGGTGNTTGGTASDGGSSMSTGGAPSTGGNSNASGGGSGTCTPEACSGFAKSSGSFDYDCNGVEESCEVFAAASSCKLGVGGCVGGGYLPTGRKGVGINEYCGSTTYLYCEFAAVGPGGCIATEGIVNPLACH